MSVIINDKKVAGILATSKLESLTDVAFNKPIQNNQVLKYDGTNNVWINGVVSTNDYLPLTGGEMTGAIKLKQGFDNGLIGKNPNDFLCISGSPLYDITNKGSAYILLYGGDNNESSGQFDIIAHKIDAGVATYIKLTGNPDGSLKWNQRNVITSNTVEEPIVKAKSEKGLFILNIKGNLVSLFTNTETTTIVNGVSVDNGTAYNIDTYELTNTWDNTTKELTITSANVVTMGLIGM